MRALLVLCALGIGAAGVNAATIQSFGPVGAPLIADTAPGSENGAAATATPSSQDSGNAPASPSGSPQKGSDPYDWLDNIHQTHVAATMSGGSQGGGRHSGGAGYGQGGGGRSRGSGGGAGRSSSGRSGSGHSGGSGHQGQAPPKG